VSFTPVVLQWPGDRCGTRILLYSVFGALTPYTLEKLPQLQYSNLQTELNKKLARIALPDDDLIEKIDKELSKGKASILKA